MAIVRPRRLRSYVPDCGEFVRLEPRLLLDGGGSATYPPGYPSSPPTNGGGSSIADDKADIDKELQEYNLALINYKLDKITYVAGVAVWKADKTDFNVRVIELKTDLKAFKDEYKPLKLKLGFENTVKPDGKVEPALKLEIDLTGIVKPFGPNGQQEFDELQDRFNGLKGELTGLNARKAELDAAAAALKTRDAELQAWYMRIQKKIKDVNYKIGMSGGQGNYNVDLEWPPDAPDALPEIALDEDALTD